MTSPTRLCLRASALLAGASLLAVWLSSVGAFGGYTGRITNSSASAGSGSLLYTHQYPNGTSGPTQCTSVPGSGNITNSIQSVACTNSVYPSTSSGSATDAITANGTEPAADVTEQVSAASCGPVELADGIGSDPLLARGDITFQAGGPLTGGNGVSLDGSTAFAAGVASENSSSVLGSSFTEGVWFKVASGYSSGGVLMGFGTSLTNGSEADYDRILWMDTSGHIHFGVSGTLGTTAVATSTGTYNKGQWYLAVGTISPGLVTSTVDVYVDTASNSTGALSLLSGYTGYWHVGWDQLSSQWDTSASPYLTGSLSDAFVVDGTAISSSQVSTLAGETTQSSWNSEMSTISASDSWTLADTGTTTYSTTPYGLSNPVCSYVDIAWSMANPSGSIATTQLSSFANGTGHTVGAPSPGGTQTITVTLSHDSTYTGTAASDLPNLVIYAPVHISMAVGSTAWHSTFGWSNVRTPTTGTSTVLM